MKNFLVKTMLIDSKVQHGRGSPVEEKDGKSPPT